MTSTGLERRLNQLEEMKPQQSPKVVRLVADGETAEEAKARWCAEHPEQVGERVHFIVRAIVDPLVRPVEVQNG